MHSIGPRSRKMFKQKKLFFRTVVEKFPDFEHNTSGKTLKITCLEKRLRGKFFKKYEIIIFLDFERNFFGLRLKIFRQGCPTTFYVSRETFLGEFLEKKN